MNMLLFLNRGMGENKKKFSIGFSRQSVITVLIIILIVILAGLSIQAGKHRKQEKRTVTVREAENVFVLPEGAQPQDNSASDITCKKFDDISEAIRNIKIACTLDLSNQNLSTLPNEILLLKNLYFIGLINNEFSEFPQILTEIDTLITIGLSENRITNIPATIGELKNLQRLDLSRNRISTLPNGISKLSSLNYLILTGNPIGKEEQNRITKLLPDAQIEF